MRNLPPRRSSFALPAFAAFLAAGALLSTCANLRVPMRAPEPAPEAKGRAADLFDAAETGEVTVIRRLLDGEAALLEARDAAGWSAVSYAAWYGRPEAYELLVERGARTNLFTEAALGPYASFVQRLKTNPMAVKSRDTRKQATPLGWAARTGNQAAIELLLSLGAEVGAADRDGDTALHYATQAQDRELCRMLLYAGADPAAGNRAGRTPLHLAAAAGSLPLCRLLLDAGAPVDAPDAEGNTPLHLAARQGELELCEYLLARGARGDIANAAGLKPYQLAAQGGYSQVERLLRAHSGEQR